METSLAKPEFLNYLSRQLNHNFPDVNVVEVDKIKNCVDIALDRLEFCLSKTNLNRYKKNGVAYFDHLFSDSYALFLCYLANTVWQQTNDKNLSSKIYYLNKIMHSFDCMYDTILPEIFLIVHGLGSVMGKAKYGNGFIIYQGCTIGANKGLYPTIGTGVSILPNSSIIGDSDIGKCSTISTSTIIFKKNIAENSIAYMNFDIGKLEIKSTKDCYAQQFFNIDLKAL